MLFRMYSDLTAFRINFDGIRIAPLAFDIFRTIVLVWLASAVLPSLVMCINKDNEVINSVSRCTFVRSLFTKVPRFSNVLVTICSVTVAVALITQTAALVVVPFCIEEIVLNFLVVKLKCFYGDVSRYA